MRVSSLLSWVSGQLILSRTESGQIADSSYFLQETGPAALVENWGPVEPGEAREAGLGTREGPEEHHRPEALPGDQPGNHWPRRSSRRQSGATEEETKSEASWS